MSVESTQRDKPNFIGLSLFLFPMKPLLILIVQETLFFKSRVRTIFKKLRF
jgi:hypothetical protein